MFFEEKLSLTKSLWLSVIAFMIFLLLQGLRMLNVLGSEFDIIVRWVSTISLILCGVFIGLLISIKDSSSREIVHLVLFIVGFFAAPFGVGLLMLLNRFSFSRGIEPVIFGGSIAGYLLLYIGFWFYLEKKTIREY